MPIQVKTAEKKTAVKVEKTDDAPRAPAKSKSKDKYSDAQRIRLYEYILQKKFDGCFKSSGLLAYQAKEILRRELLHIEYEKEDKQ